MGYLEQHRLANGDGHVVEQVGEKFLLRTKARVAASSNARGEGTLGPRTGAVWVVSGVMGLGVPRGARERWGSGPRVCARLHVFLRVGVWLCV